MLTPQLLPKGARLLVEIVSKAGHLSVLGRVSYCVPLNAQMYRMGLQVDAIPPNHQATWRKMVSR